MNPSQVDQEQSWFSFGQPKLGWHWLPAFFGLPVETYSRKIRHPVIITTFIAIFVCTYFYAQSYGEDLFALSYGFIPGLWERYATATLITSFFMHASWLHLLGNAYYFYIFGDDVNDDLGTLNFTVLLFGAHFTGMLAHVVFGGGIDIPVIGASAGISGLLGYYLFRFPHRRISYMLLFLFSSTLWLHVPAAVAFLIKFGWEIFLTNSTTNSEVAHTAHLGGAFFGLIFAMLFAPRAGEE